MTQIDDGNTDRKTHLHKGQKIAKWDVREKLGEGSFGDVYLVKNSAGASFAMKTEKIDDNPSALKIEVYVLTNLSRMNSTHFCKIEDCGTFSNFRYIVMTLVGPSLQELRRKNSSEKFSMGTALSVGVKCVGAIEELQSLMGVLHRDIKPGNFAIGDPNKRQIYLIDFGMARQFLDSEGKILPPRLSVGFRGTFRYASISCHIARELCRKDDLESWLYMQIEFTRGRLPWKDLKTQDEVCQLKQRCRDDDKLNELFGGCPQEYVEIMRYLETVQYTDKPDYSKLKLFNKLKYRIMAQRFFGVETEKMKFGTVIAVL
ncbi:protein kinase domain-containing protein [Ditylenchus destructor]|uniref:Protein kinase domain-containing protein n=1 Tax=Ditylenchus destructor TaxID=166010 RepID=A0AAD4R0E1_9BILA|nr:protein kinase domain-containing protein [Ditylenchus destructor]